MSKNKTSIFTKIMHDVRDQNDNPTVEEVITTHNRFAAPLQLVRVGLMTAAAIGAVILVATATHNLLEEESNTEDN